MSTIKNKKRISQLVRMLSSSHQGEVIAVRDAIQKLCSFNDLGDLIEGGSSLSQAEMQTIYNAGFEDGNKHGFEKGKQEGKANLGRPFQDVIDNSTEQERIVFCQKHKDRLQKKREKEFIENLVHWTTVLKRNLTPGQVQWLNDIYTRLGGR
jgi:hypothetical protein